MSKLAEISFWRGTADQFKLIPKDEILNDRIYLVFGKNGVNGLFLGEYLLSTKTDIINNWVNTQIYNAPSSKLVSDRFAEVEKIFTGLPDDPNYKFDVIKNWVSEHAVTKDKEESINHLFTCLLGSEYGEYISGISGAKISSNGDAEFEDLNVRGVLRGSAFVQNNLTFSNSETWFNDGGTIDSFTDIGNSMFRVKPVLNQGEVILQKDNDLCVGEVHNNDGVSQKTYFKILSIDNINNTFVVQLAQPSETPKNLNGVIQENMRYVRIGNTVDVTRQRASYFSANDGQYRYLTGVTSFTINNDKLSIQLGSVTDSFLPEYIKEQYKDYNAFIDKLIVRDIVRVSDSGEAIVTPIDRGEWVSGVTYRLMDEVDHIGCIWQCCSTTETIEEPATFASDWRLRVGDKKFYMEIESTEGTAFVNANINTDLIALVYRGTEDVSAHIHNYDWVWERDSGDTESDTIWNLAHRNIGNKCPITFSDLGDIVKNRLCKFIITAYIKKEDNAIATLKKIISI